MENNLSVEKFYQYRIEEFTSQLTKTKQYLQRIAWLRLFIALLSFLLLYKTWSSIPTLLWLAEAIGCIALFLYIVSKDVTAKEKAVHLERLIDINNEEIKIIHNHFSHREAGLEYLPPQHTYAEDVDLFGKASLYQYINRCTSQQGKKKLADKLLYPSTQQQIKKEQESVAELKNKTEFIQQLQALGIANKLTNSTENKMATWIQSSLQFTANYWQWLVFVFPVLTMLSVFLYIINILPSGVFWLFVFVCYLISFFISSRINETYKILSNVSGEIKTLQRQLETIEKQTFTSAKLLHFQQLLRNANGTATVTEIKKLYNILNRFDVRLNHFLFFFLNTFLLWDLQQLLALNKWKLHNQQSVLNWFDVIAEVEKSNSLAVLYCNHPAWCMPVITDDFFTINVIKLGHPLLPEEDRVDNNFSLQGKSKIAVVTGSNMGGKSTFLRSVGANTVLALMGAPVCAESFAISVVKLMTSMRVADNLAESTSTFYAELKKLKTIIEAVNQGEPVLILLDEILRGTNSFDRHTGSVALLKQLIKKNAVAIVATHDVDLAKMETQFPQAIQNYHFDVQATGDELHFDYKLKEGICQSLNASILMKNIGIEME